MQGIEVGGQGRGAEGAEGVERVEGVSPKRGEVWGVSCAPSLKNFDILRSKWRVFVDSWKILEFWTRGKFCSSL